MGVVYRARHIKLARSFAIKVLHPQLLTNEKVRRRFEREAEVAAKLRHENVIGVVDVGETSEGLRFLVMDFAEGDTLGALISLGAMTSTRTLKILQQLCEGLQHAHDAGLIHRDFKPDNVIVQRDKDGAETPRIVDFGIALLRDEASSTERERLTTAGIVLGTPHYMAPEHASGGEVDHRIDLFALGVISFEMLTGRLPFDGEGAEVARANMMFEPPRMRQVAPHVDIDPLLEAFTRKLMARSLDDRIPSARAARDILDLIEKDRDAAADALGAARPRPKSPTQRPMLAMPIVSRTRSANTEVPGSATSTVNTDSMPTRAMPALGQRRTWIVAVLVLMMIAGIVVATRLSSTPVRTAPIAKHTLAPSPPPALTPAPAPVPPAIAQPAPDTVVAPAPVHVVVGAASSKLSKRPLSTSPPMGMPLPSSTIAPPDLTPTAAELAQFYAAVGRKLSALEKTRGLPATLDLWPRYRNIRIQALLASPMDRRRGTARLQEIERAVDAAAATP